jgi:hypothetical protein
MRTHIEHDVLSELDERVIVEAANPVVRVVTEVLRPGTP